MADKLEVVSEVSEVSENIPENFNKEFFDCCYETEECAINQHILNEKIIDVMIKNHIEIGKDLDILDLDRNVF